MQIPSEKQLQETVIVSGNRQRNIEPTLGTPCTGSFLEVCHLSHSNEYIRQSRWGQVGYIPKNIKKGAGLSLALPCHIDAHLISAFPLPHDPQREREPPAEARELEERGPDRPGDPRLS